MPACIQLTAKTIINLIVIIIYYINCIKSTQTKDEKRKENTINAQ